MSSSPAQAQCASSSGLAAGPPGLPRGAMPPALLLSGLLSSRLAAGLARLAPSSVEEVMGTLFSTTMSACWDLHEPRAVAPALYGCAAHGAEMIMLLRPLDMRGRIARNLSAKEGARGVRCPMRRRASS